MEKLKQIFEANHGYARMKELKNQGIHTRKIAQAVENRIVEKVKPGLYKLVDYPWDENSSFIGISQAKDSAVICLTSAIAYYELSTINPSVISVAVPMNTDKFKLEYPPIKVYYFSESLYNLGIDEVQVVSGNFKIYNAEKTICDLFRYRNKLGEDIALEGLKNYLGKESANINKLWDYAIRCKVKTILHPYIKAMV
ncbi:MAG: type IV toxin-antitoxin system AbiEi family antitoxin domain-containing protein [Candidatus Cloacimonetes bacterium]|nr:type IV toxin-antitoxin system AbiEi family antitoxin domain-containing protein [Candidatus Cloacimonadota bacterium]